MTTQSSTTAIAHTTDADFRAWGGELSAMLTAAGLPLAGDTGQANWATATIPTTNGSVYEIRYLNDSLHATKPIYFKIEYGTTSTSGRPNIWITAGSGTNGAGTITGTTYFARLSITTNGAAPGGSTYFTGVCVLPGYFAFTWKRGYTTSSYGTFFAACRSCDDAGDITATGFVFYATSNGSSPCMRWTYVTASNADSYGYALFPGGQTVTLVSGSPQVMRHWMMQPQIRCVPFLVSFVNSEIGDLSTFTATPVGDTSRTFLALSTDCPSSCGIGATGAMTTARIGMQWE